MIRRRVDVLLWAALFAATVARTPLCRADDDAKQTERIAELEKSLTAATLVGHFTNTAVEGFKPEVERYELGQVKRLEGERWLIEARIRYAEHDVPIPLTLPIRWAGDTPVICVDDLTIPGLGTFTARVMIYRDHYAGFWTAKDHGGDLFGIVEHASKKSDEAADKSK